jgi:hypothetical protein
VKSRDLEYFLTVLYIKSCLLSETINLFNYNLTLLGVIAATWVKFASEIVLLRGILVNPK